MTVDPLSTLRGLLSLPVLSHLIAFIEYLSENILAAIALSILVLVVSWRMSEGMGLGSHTSTYSQIWLLRIIMVAVPVATLFFPQISELPWLGLLPIEKFRDIVTAQLLVDIAGAAILHHRGRHRLEHVFTSNFLIVTPYLAAIPMVLYEHFHLGEARIEERGREGVYLGRVRYGVARISRTSMSGEGVSVTTDEWTPIKARGELHFDPLREINPHLLVTGISGAGKGVTVMNILTQLTKLGHPITILDYNGEYASKAEPLGADVFDVAGQGLNPFTPVAEEDSVECANDMITAINIFSHVEEWKLGSNQQEWLHEISEKLGAKTTVEAVIRRLRRMREDERHLRLYETMTGLIGKLNLLQAGFAKPTGLSFQDILNWSAVIDFSGISNLGVRTIAVELFLVKLRRFIESRGVLPASVKVNGFLVVDEAHRIAKRDSSLDVLMRETRKYGLGCIVLSQFATDFDEAIRGNPALQLYLLSFSEKDIDAIVNVTGCSILPQIMPNLRVDPENKVFEAVVLKAGRNTIDRLRKTSLGKGAATTTLYVVRLKPYYHEAGTKEKEEEKSADQPIEEAATLTHDSRLEAIRRIKDVRIPKAVTEDIGSRDVDSLLNISKAAPEDLERLRDRLMLVGDGNAPTGWGVRIIKAVGEAQKEIDRS